ELPDELAADRRGRARPRPERLAGGLARLPHLVLGGLGEVPHDVGQSARVAGGEGALAGHAAPAYEVTVGLGGAGRGRLGCRLGHDPHDTTGSPRARRAVRPVQDGAFSALMAGRGTGVMLPRPLIRSSEAG